MASILSEMYDRRLVPARDSRATVNSDVRTVLFVEDTNYKVLYGCGQGHKGENETASGDNYVCTQERRTVCHVPVGWNGVRAGGVPGGAEAVVEILEQFLTTGFSRETAARMLNSALRAAAQGMECTRPSTSVH